MTLALSCLALPFLRFVLPVSVFVSCVNLEKIVLGQPFHAQISRAGPSWSKPPGYCSVERELLAAKGTRLPRGHVPPPLPGEGQPVQLWWWTHLLQKSHPGTQRMTVLTHSTPTFCFSGAMHLLLASPC